MTSSSDAASEAASDASSSSASSSSASSSSSSSALPSNPSSHSEPLPVDSHTVKDEPPRVSLTKHSSHSHSQSHSHSHSVSSSHSSRRQSPSASRTASFESTDQNASGDQVPSKEVILPVSEVQPRGSISPHDIIHSVATRPGVPPIPSSETTASPRSRKFSIFSPRSVRNLSPLRRLFSPRRPNPIPSDQDTDSSTADLNTQGRTWFPCSCFTPKPSLEDSLQELDYVERIKTLEPTYEPEQPLLPSPSPSFEDRICLVLDLDETLVHSSFSPLPDADFEIPLDMQGDVHTVYVKKRPGVDHFLKKASEWYEIVIFTASLALYANPVVDLLDPHNLVQLRLYREHCVLIGGCYVKDIAKLGRDLRRTVIIDNSPLSYVLQPENAIPIPAFFTDENDTELEKTLALLESARDLDDVRIALNA